MINYKWLTFNCVTLFVTAYLVQFYDAFHLLLALDKTRITLIIGAIYVLCSLYLGLKGYKANFKAVAFQASMMTSTGLIGTVLAIMIMLFGAQDISTFKQNVIAEMAPVFITSLFGLGLSYALNQQMALCFGVYNDE